MAVARTVWLSFHLGCHRSVVSLSALNVSPLTQPIAPVWGLDPCFSSSRPSRRGQIQSNTSVFPPSSFILLSFVWAYMFFSARQVLLSALSWCSACTSVFEGVFLMCPWREMYSMSAYSSAILFSLLSQVLILVKAWTKETNIFAFMEPDCIAEPVLEHFQWPKAVSLEGNK